MTPDSDSGASVLTGRRLGAFEVQERIGVGGMGEVYRAHDTKLGRDVAIKILPSHFTSDPDRLARFEREARVLASLNHPHIGAIYGLEDADGVRALVLELVQGETLADRIARGPIPVADALIIGRQIADALDAAHEKGIVHRDLKPANIKTTPDGVVKVLDFGLAKATSGDTPAPDLTHSPTATFGGTRGGIILGTPAYMSPEQARGQAVDKRTDIWAFGCVLYEMLTARAAFAGNTVSDTIAAVLEREPVWSTLPTTTPATIRALLKRCLEKDPKRRVRDIGDARIELDDRGIDRDEESSRAANRFPMWAALVTGVLIGATMVWGLMRSRSGATELGPARFAITAPAEAPQIGGAPVSSPDGRHIAFVATNASGEGHLWIRSLDSMTARRIDGTDGAESPFWSPDGRFIGFGVPAQRRLKRVDLSTGNIQSIVNISDALEGGAWSTEGVIVLARRESSCVPLETVSGCDPSRDQLMVTRLTEAVDFF